MSWGGSSEAEEAKTTTTGEMNSEDALPFSPGPAGLNSH